MRCSGVGTSLGLVLDRDRVDGAVGLTVAAWVQAVAEGVSGRGRDGRGAFAARKGSLRS